MVQKKVEKKFVPRKKQFFVLSYDEFEKLLIENFSKAKDYNIAYENDCSNGTNHICSISKGDDESERYGKNLTLEKIKKEHMHEQIDYMLWSLACKKIIPFGNYIINISW